MPCSTSNSITRRSDDPGKNARARSGRSANAASTAVRPIQLTAALVSATRISLNHLSSDGLGSSGSTNVQATMSGCRSTAVRNDFNTCRFCAAVRHLKKLLISKTWSPADPARQHQHHHLPQNHRSAQHRPPSARAARRSDPPRQPHEGLATGWTAPQQDSTNFICSTGVPATAGLAQADHLLKQLKDRGMSQVSAPPARSLMRLDAETPAALDRSSR